MDDELIEAGVLAYEIGVFRETCPYPPQSRERKLWLEGWDEARSVAEEDAKDSV